jgi:mono/diheme cytochrome c family protein
MPRRVSMWFAFGAGAVLGGLLLAVLGLAGPSVLAVSGFLDQPADTGHPWDAQVREHTRTLEDQGREVFRYDTFGSETFFGNTIGLHRAIEGSNFGGVGSGVSPKTALSVGLKVDADALPGPVVQAIGAGQVNLDDPAVTLTLLQLGAVVGVEGIFNDPADASKGLKAVGITCAICHATVDDSFAPGIGHRLDGWANQDLNVGAIVALSPNLQPVADLLNSGGGSTRVDVDTVRKVLMSWGPGRFDAELFFDGKAFRPDGGNASTLIPDAFGMAGVNNHNWTGSWGTVTYWNALVANLEMHGTPGTFLDEKLDDAKKYPIAAANRMGHLSTPPGEDRISPKLPALHFYQLSLPTPRPPAGSFDASAAGRGQAVFDGRGRCATCHVPPTFTEPGRNLHLPEEIGIDAFQAQRAPDDRYRTAPLAGRLWKRKTDQTRGFYHDGRYKSLREVVDHYDTFLKLGLSDAEKGDLVEYLKSI